MATDNVNPDYVALAKSYDIESYCCRTVDELPEVIEKFVNAKVAPARATPQPTPQSALPMGADCPPPYFSTL